MFCRNNFQILSNAVEGNCDHHLFVIATAWTRTMFQACPTLYCEAFFEVFAAVMNAVLVYFPLSLKPSMPGTSSGVFTLFVRTRALMKFSREYAKFRIFYERIKFVSLKNAPKLQETIAAAKLRPQRQNNLSSAFELQMCSQCQVWNFMLWRAQGGKSLVTSDIQIWHEKRSPYGNFWTKTWMSWQVMIQVPPLKKTKFSENWLLNR